MAALAARRRKGGTRFVPPKTAEDAVPVRRIWPDGVCLTDDGEYAKTWRVSDVNYAAASKEDKEAMFLGYSELLNALDTGSTTKITINNKRLNRRNFEREILLDDMVRSGTVLDAAVSSELLKNIFFVKAPMHDGAVIVRNGRVLGAGCMLPLSKNVNLSRELGMRHRAGIGMSENADAVVVIVSEETGSISVAIGGMLKRHLKPETLANILRNELLPQEAGEDKPKFSLMNLLRAGSTGGDNHEK